MKSEEKKLDKTWSEHKSEENLIKILRKSNELWSKHKSEENLMKFEVYRSKENLMKYEVNINLNKI